MPSCSTHDNIFHEAPDDTQPIVWDNLTAPFTIGGPRWKRDPDDLGVHIEEAAFWWYRVKTLRLQASFHDGMGSAVWSTDKILKRGYSNLGYTSPDVSVFVVDEPDISLHNDAPQAAKGFVAEIGKTPLEFPDYVATVFLSFLDGIQHHLPRPITHGWYPPFTFSAGDVTSVGSGGTAADNFILRLDGARPDFVTGRTYRHGWRWDVDGETLNDLPMRQIGAFCYGDATLTADSFWAYGGLYSEQTGQPV